MKKYYSGKKSKKIWKRIYKLPYELFEKIHGKGVLLQNLEEEVLRELKEYRRWLKTLPKEKKCQHKQE